MGLKTVKTIYTGWRRWLIDLTVILLVIFVVRGYQQRDVITGIAPPIQGHYLDNTILDWQAFKGQPYMIHFWASWCPICRFEENSIAAIAEDYPVLTVAAWSGDENSVRNYLQERGLKLPVLVDEDGLYAEAYGLHGVPATFIVDAEGVIQFAEVGYSSEWGLRLRLWWLGI